MMKANPHFDMEAATGAAGGGEIGGAPNATPDQTDVGNIGGEGSTGNLDTPNPPENTTDTLGTFVKPEPDETETNNPDSTEEVKEENPENSELDLSVLLEHPLNDFTEEEAAEFRKLFEGVNPASLEKFTPIMMSLLDTLQEYEVELGKHSKTEEVNLKKEWDSLTDEERGKYSSTEGFFKNMLGEEFKNVIPMFRTAEAVRAMMKIKSELVGRGVEDFVGGDKTIAKYTEQEYLKDRSDYRNLIREGKMVEARKLDEAIKEKMKNGGVEELRKILR